MACFAGCVPALAVEPTDASSGDVPVVDGAMQPDDVPPAIIVAPPSCLAIRRTNTALPSGTYLIDPDGVNGDPPSSVTCDMDVDGGGWTIVYFAPTEALDGAPGAYTAGNARLMADAQHVLIAYRNATQGVYPNYARFDLPAAWRTQTPFGYPGNDLVTGVSVNGGALVTATVRYGRANFWGRCEDQWFTLPGDWGRICVVGTQAPFFNTFMLQGTDYCSDSSQPYTATPCTDDRRFSIAVR